MTAAANLPPNRVYGRHRGRPLRVGQQQLKASLLPERMIELPESGPLDLAGLFPVPPQESWLEIGYGGGEHLAAQAEAHPDIGFIGCEVFDNGIVKLLGEISRRNLENIRLYADDARTLLQSLPPQSVDRVFILFPDPWPKRRHHKRRLIAPATLDRLAEIMTDGAELRLATDDRDYLVWMLQYTTAHPCFKWLARRPGDWRERPPDGPATRYERKAVKAGRQPAFLRFQRRPRA